MPVSPPPAPRLASLDALRGFDMFWIIGGGAIHGGLKTVGESATANFVLGQLSHAGWEGFHFLDLVFPMFVFIAGVSLAFSLPRSVGRTGRAATAARLGRRALVLFILGVIFSG
jgi:predicted acyltransferase